MGVDKSLVRSVLFLLQAHCCWGQSKMIVPSQSIVVPVGSDVTLPCEVDPVKNLKDLVVEWARPDLKPRYIHIRRDGLDLLIDQNPQYQGRTQLWERGLQIGDMSLKLSRVRLSDGGTYRCFLPQMDTAGEVTLIVVAVSPVAVSLTKDHSGSPVLRCESRGWYPEPELLWLDSDGTVLTGGRTEVQRGVSDETFSVSSRLSVEQSPGNTFTCRVRQHQSRQSRETQITVTGEFLEACASCSGAWTLFVLGLLVAAAAGAFVWWKYKTQKNKSAVPEVKVEESGEGVHVESEESPLLEAEEKAQCDEQKLNEYKEACLRITEELQFIEDTEALSGSKDFLLKLKDILHQCNHELSTDIKVKKEKIKASKVIFHERPKNKKREEQIQKNNSQLTKFRDTIAHTEEQIGKINEIIHKAFERKGKLKEEHKQMTKLLENERQRLGAAVSPAPGEEDVKLKVVDETVIDDLCSHFSSTGLGSRSPVNGDVREEQPGEEEAEEGSTSVYERIQLKQREKITSSKSTSETMGFSV